MRRHPNRAQWLLIWTAYVVVAFLSVDWIRFGWLASAGRTAVMETVNLDRR